MATRSSVLSWRIPGTGEPGGLLSMGLQRVGHDWGDLAAAAADSAEGNCSPMVLTSSWLIEFILLVFIWIKFFLLGKIIFTFSLKIKHFLIINMLALFNVVWITHDPCMFAYHLCCSTLWQVERLRKKKSMAKKIWAQVKAQSFQHDNIFQILLSTEYVLPVYKKGRHINL